MVKLTWAALLYGALAQDYSNIGKYTGVGCYASLSSGFTKLSSSSANSWLACYTTCNNAGYSVMAMQSEDCWCSDEIPAGSTTDTCDISCYGDLCGGSAAYNVIERVGASPSTAGSNTGSSTSGGSSSTTTSESASSSTTDSSSTTGSSGTTTTASSSTSTAGQSTIVVSGSVITVTASASATSTSSSTSSAATAEPSKNGLSGGAIAGIVVGSIAGLAALGALLFFVLRRRKDEFYSPNSSPHRFETSFNSGYNQEYPSVVDQRLNPQLLNHRISIASLADARDYSRQILKVANPDDKE